VNVGVTVGFTVTETVWVVAHCPVEGVKVYMVVPGDAVLMADGDHVPLTPLLDMPGREAGVSPWQ
jgi:hypothetical protein